MPSKTQFDYKKEPFKYEGLAYPYEYIERKELFTSTDQRNQAQKDRDLILYTTELRRLAESTQIVSAEEGHVFHNRLTHSLEVAQIARRISEFVVRTQGKQIHSIVEETGDIGYLTHPDIAEASALAHDLGHPPFGHLAEKTLRELIQFDGGFDGNAQTFRIICKLCSVKQSSHGLNLTRATLNGILKYPWLYDTAGDKSRKKWGCFRTEKEYFDFAREHVVDDGQARKTVDAEIMDWADDIAYSELVPSV